MALARLIGSKDSFRGLLRRDMIMRPLKSTLIIKRPCMLSRCVVFSYDPVTRRYDLSVGLNTARPLRFNRLQMWSYVYLRGNVALSHSNGVHVGLLAGRITRAPQRNSNTPPTLLNLHVRFFSKWRKASILQYPVINSLYTALHQEKSNVGFHPLPGAPGA